MPKADLKLFAGQGQSGDYMLPHLGSIINDIIRFLPCKDNVTILIFIALFCYFLLKK